MTNKLISIILSVVLIAGIFPAIAQAESEDTIVFQADFEAFSSGEVFNENFAGATIRHAEEPHYFSLGKAVKGEIVKMTGYDGKPTNALKITTKPASASTTDGAYRLNYYGFTPPTSGIYVAELKVYTPEQTVNSDGETVYNDISRVHGSPFIKDKNYYGSGYATGQYKTVVPVNYGGWVKLKYVQNLDTGCVSVYVNDELKKFNALTDNKTIAKRLQIYSRYNYLNTDEALIFDDFNFYVPSVTTASSVYSEAEEVSVNVNPTVDFSQELYDPSLSGAPVISASNAEVTDIVTGSKVAVRDVMLSADRKKVTVDIKDPLGYSTKYEVKLTGLKDMYGADIPEYKFTFTTKPQPPFSVSEPVFTKENIGVKESTGEVITSLENGHINASYTVVNNSTTDVKDVFMFVVLREGRKLRSIQYKDITLEPLSQNTFNAGFNIDDSQNQSIETYVWDSLSGKIALGSSYTITADGVTTTATE